MIDHSVEGLSHSHSDSSHDAVDAELEEQETRGVYRVPTLTDVCGPRASPEQVRLVMVCVWRQ